MPSDVMEAYELLAAGKTPFKKLITGGYPQKDIGMAFERLSKGEGIKYAIVP